METKIVKTLSFENDSNNQYQINAVKLEGHTVQEIRESVTTDDLSAGTTSWLFDCGTSTINVY